MKNIIKKSYEFWDYPIEFQPPLSGRDKPLKTRKTPLKIKKTPLKKMKEEPQKILIQRLYDDIKNRLIKVRIRKPVPISPVKGAPPISYISNIVIGNKRIGYFEQTAGGDRVALKFEKSNRIPLWHNESDSERILEKINEEVEKYYVKRLAAKFGYKTTIKILSHRRSL